MDDEGETVPVSKLLSTEDGAADNIAKEDGEFFGMPQKEVNDPVLPQSPESTKGCTRCLWPAPEGGQHHLRPDRGDSPLHYCPAQGEGGQGDHGAPGDCTEIKQFPHDLSLLSQCLSNAHCSAKSVQSSTNTSFSRLIMR